jgi:hypothetical protein
MRVLWNTISPDGKYAMAWSTTGSVALDDLPLPDETNDNPVSNHVIEVVSGKIVLTLPGGHYWEGYGAAHPNHFSLETVWSEDSRSKAFVSARIDELKARVESIVEEREKP